LPRSPRIAAQSWGRIDLEDGRRFKDAKLYPGGGAEWDWGKTGTRHDPGIQPADLDQLLAAGAEVVVLSRGVYKRLKTPAETLALLKDRGVSVHVLQTEEAVRVYNTLCQDWAVGGLFHSTC